MKLYVLKERELGKRDPMIYGHFIEHFHRQIYGGVYDPGNELSDEDGFRTDVLDAMRKIKVPILRWPGGGDALCRHTTGKMLWAATESPCSIRRGAWKIRIHSGRTNI